MVTESDPQPLDLPQPEPANVTADLPEAAFDPPLERRATVANGMSNGAVVQAMFGIIVTVFVLIPSAFTAAFSHEPIDMIPLIVLGGIVGPLGLAATGSNLKDAKEPHLKWRPYVIAASISSAVWLAAFVAAIIVSV
ncbi:MAG: hypothetical protein LBR19_00290 [Bifidobacteriaceae bacterium]|jgi:hypothetical protein|nr:hypothetical protein [Bifidobacteriaceae bacterium]